jgi:hypothetical protein
MEGDEESTVVGKDHFIACEHVWRCVIGVEESKMRNRNVIGIPPLLVLSHTTRFPCTAGATTPYVLALFTRDLDAIWRKSVGDRCRLRTGVQTLDNQT